MRKYAPVCHFKIINTAKLLLKCLKNCSIILISTLTLKMFKIIIIIYWIMSNVTPSQAFPDIIVGQRLCSWDKVSIIIVEGEKSHSFFIHKLYIKGTRVSTGSNSFQLCDWLLHGSGCMARIHWYTDEAKQVIKSEIHQGLRLQLRYWKTEHLGRTWRMDDL